jgi:alpha-amylase
MLKRYWLLLILPLVLLLAGCTTTAVTPTPEPTPTLSPLPQASDGYPWWNHTVFYEIFVRSFYDSTGDGIGDLPGLIEKLDYLNDGDPTTTDDLGITGIWLMPINVSPSYHGYDVVDYYEVNPEYGTNEDFQRLIEEAHKRGIRVIVDLVVNHTSTQHPWFIDARSGPDAEYRDWYVWADEDPGWRGPEGQPVWHRTPHGYYYAVFWDGMPDLNLENPEVTAEMYEIARYWLEDMGADGFRLDAIKHLIERGPIQENTRDTHEWLQGFYNFIKEVNPDAVSVGEAWTNTQQVLRYTDGGVDIAFQFDLALAAINSINSGFATQVGREQRAIVRDFPPGQYATFLTNHDQNRVMSQFQDDVGKAKLAATWLLTSPGVPFIYYGEEIGQQGTKPDEDIRRPMQWTSDSYRVGFTEGRPWRVPYEDFETKSVALQEDDPDSLLNHYRALIHLRNRQTALRVGDWVQVDSQSNRVYAYLRYTDEAVLLVVMNLGPNELDEYALSLAEGPLTAVSAPILLFGDGQPAELTLNAAGGFENYTPFPSLPPQSSFVIQLYGSE